MNKRYPIFLPLFLVAIFFSTFFIVVKSYAKTNIPTKHYPTEIYANHMQDDLRLALKKAILDAKQSICLIIYTLTDPQIIQALRKRAEEGLDVKVVCDSEASKLAFGRLGSKVTLVPRRSKGIMHMKILVTDQRRVWIGSANMTCESLRFHGNLVLGFYHPGLAKFILSKAENMDSEFPCQNFSVNKQSIEFWTLPNRKDASDRINKLIETAKKTVRVAMFTWTRNDFTESLISARERGVDVKVVMDRYAGHGANRKIVEKLAQANIPISFSEGNALLHYKMMLIDDQILVNGSANWTKSAFVNNDDCFIVLQKLTSPQRKKLRDLWKIIEEESTVVPSGSTKETAASSG